jgi:hypothetical protein
MYGSHNACVSAELFAERVSQGFRGFSSASASLGGKVLRAYGQGAVGVALVYGVRWRIIAGCKRMIQFVDPPTRRALTLL